jgi:hypothetical protein
MLASITPLGERGRQTRWGLTVTAFLLGATAAGAALGALAGATGGLVLAGSFQTHTRLLILALAALAAIALDARRAAAPGPRRQVNERWLDQYRGWVYGLSYGAQLGIALATVVSSAATYVALVAAVLSADAARGALIVGCFGLIRGLTPLATWRVQSPPQLVSLHRWLADRRQTVRALAIAGLTAILVLAAAGSVR